MEIRTGIGWDVHRIAPGRPLMLGGVRVEAEFGLLGHSDADVLIHAITDAVLGAASLGDIGQHFPDSDPRWSGASSDQFLRHALALVREQGFEIVHVDTVIIAERPKLGGYREAIRKRLAEVLELDPERISVKFKTAEGLDSVGAGQAVQAQAVVTLQRESSK